MKYSMSIDISVIKPIVNPIRMGDKFYFNVF